MPPPIFKLLESKLLPPDQEEDQTIPPTEPPKEPGAYTGQQRVTPIGYGLVSVEVYGYDPIAGIPDMPGKETWHMAEIREPRDAGGGGGGNDALQAATAALRAYMRASELAQARKLSAFQEARSLLPLLVSPQLRQFPGLEAGGALSTAMGRFGLPFTPIDIQHQQINPAELLAQPAEQELGAGILSRINAIGGAVG